MTNEQKQIISENSRKYANDGRNNIYVYDLKDNKEYLFTSSTEAEKSLNLNKLGLKNCRKTMSGAYLNRYIIGRSKEELYSNIDHYNEYIENHQDNKHFVRYSLEEYIKFKEENPTLSAIELSKLLGVCKKTIYNYENQLPKNLQTFNINKELILWKIENIETKEIYIVNVYEGAELFQTSLKHFRQFASRCSENGNFYKKLYKISRTNGRNI